MSELVKQLSSELEIAREKGWTYPGEGKPPGEYLGAATLSNLHVHYYKDGEKYWIETDFDQMMREKQRKKVKKQKPSWCCSRIKKQHQYQ